MADLKAGATVAKTAGLMVEKLVPRMVAHLAGSKAVLTAN